MAGGQRVAGSGWENRDAPPPATRHPPSARLPWWLRDLIYAAVFIAILIGASSGLDRQALVSRDGANEKRSHDQDHRKEHERLQSVQDQGTV